ncbi:MAG: BRCT domain-containing protein [Planctomycetes bacterium]|nr:BRCT domain-containing protein [Planctomycetota bacterium]
MAKYSTIAGNVYYLGRRSFPLIFVWVFFGLAIGVSGVVSLFHTLGRLTSQTELLDSLRERQFEVVRTRDGTDIEVAKRGLERYRVGRGGMGAEETFHRDLSEARYNRIQREEILAAISENKPASDVDLLLEKFRIVGLNEQVQLEKDLIRFYEEFINGSKSSQELMNIYNREKHRIPPEVASMMDRNFDIVSGATAAQSELTGLINNLEEEVKDLKLRVTTSLDSSGQKFSEQHQVFDELKTSFFDKDRTLASKNENLSVSQKKDWDSYIKKTEGVVESRRNEARKIYDLDAELNRFEKLALKRRAEGVDYVPMVDLVDGSVLSANDALEIAVIDIGRFDGLRLGQQFEVFRMKGEVRHETKGKIEVTKLFSHIALCKIIESKRLLPITAGDTVSNGPTDFPFDRKFKLKYFLLGRFVDEPRESLVAAMIKNSGGVITQELTKAVNHVVLGQEIPKEELELCSQLGLSIIRATDLADHLGFSKDEVERLDNMIWRSGI